MKKKERIPLKNGYEFDALTKARKWYKYLNKPGVVKKIKNLTTNVSENILKCLIRMM
jgi:hypothetical protein